MIAADGRRRSVQAADVKGVVSYHPVDPLSEGRAIQGNGWHKVGYERVQEIEKP